MEREWLDFVSDASDSLLSLERWLSVFTDTFFPHS